MNSKTPPNCDSYNPYRYGGVTSAMLRRFAVSLGFWTAGVLGIASGLLNIALLVVVNLFSLENEAWRRADNPISLSNALLGFVIGSLAIYGAVGSGRRRIVIVGLAIVAAVLDGLYDLGLFEA